MKVEKNGQIFCDKVNGRINGISILVPDTVENEIRIIKLNMNNSIFEFEDREIVKVTLEKSNYESVSKTVETDSKIIIFVELFIKGSYGFWLIKPRKKKGIWNKIKNKIFLCSLGSFCLETPFKYGDIIKITIEKQNKGVKKN